jgi:hypothetical protein
MNDYEAHLSSYDHSHKQRLKDMKAMVRDPTAAARARRQEQKAHEGAVVSIKLGDSAAAGDTGGGGGGGFKKGGFKKTGFKVSAFVPVASGSAAGGGGGGVGGADSKGEGGNGDGGGGLKRSEAGVDAVRATKSELVESDTEDEGYEVYDPWKPTD